MMQALYPVALTLRFASLKEPVDAIFVGQVSVAAKGHIPQIIEELFVCSDGQLVENGSQVVVLSANNIHGDRIALSRCSRGVEPICSGKLDDAAFQVRESHFVTLPGRHVALHGRVADPGDGQLPTETRLVKGHSFGAVAIKE